MERPREGSERADRAASPSGLSPEAELVRLLSRVELTDTARRTAQDLLREGLDWPWIANHVAFHGTLPLVGEHLASFDASHLELGHSRVGQSKPESESVLTAIQDRRRQTTTGNLFMQAEMVRVADRFREEGIATVHFKGAMLATRAFGGIGRRTFADLDVLVHESDARLAREILLSDGYRSTLSPDGEELHLRKSYWLGFRHDNGLFKVDLHWKLADPFFRYEPDLATLWSNVETVAVAGAEIQTFGPEDTVMILAAHGFKHGYERLKWVCDLCEWIRSHPELDWRSIRETARELRVERILAVSLLLVHELDGDVLPEEVVDYAKDGPRSIELRDRVWSSIFHGAPSLVGWRGEWFHARGREEWRDAVGYLAHQALRRFKRAVQPNERDLAIANLPRCLAWCYYVLRPVRLLATALRRTR